MLQNIDIDKEMDVISVTSSFSGNFHFGRYTRIEGTIEGNIKSSGLLIAEPTSHLNANIAGSMVVIHGTVHGDIMAERIIVIEATAIVTGDMKAPHITIKDGARINGVISMAKYHSHVFKQLEAV